MGIVESVTTVDGETIAKVRLGAPTDADVEHARRRMVDIFLTGQALDYAYRQSHDETIGDAAKAATSDVIVAAMAYLAAKRARGWL